MAVCCMCREIADFPEVEWVWDAEKYLPVCDFCFFRNEDLIEYCQEHGEYFFCDIQCPNEEE